MDLRPLMRLGFALTEAVIFYGSTRPRRIA